MKKVISLLVSMAMLFSMCTTIGMAYDEDGEMVDKTIMYNSDGEKLEFTIEETTDNEYEIKFYIEGELIRTHRIATTGTISSTDVKTGQTEVLKNSNDAEERTTISRGPIRWNHVGYVHYKYSSYIGGESCAAVSYHSPGGYSDSYYVDTDGSEKIDFVVTGVAGTLLGLGITASGGGLALTIAQALVSDMIIAVGASVVGDLISTPFKERYEYVVTEYELTGTVVGNGKSGESAILTGSKYIIEYDGEEYGGGYTGFTPDNWDEPYRFAQELWDLSIGTSFPGVIGYPYSYPL